MVASTAPISWVKALQDFFTKMPHGKKIEVSEFKALSFEDKLEIREMLIAEGYNVEEVKPPSTE